MTANPTIDRPAPGSGSAGGSSPSGRSTRRSAERREWLQLWVPAGALILLIAACFLGPIVFDLPDPSVGNLADSRLSPFTAGHVLGTDAVGNDLLSRTIYGGRVSFIVGVVSIIFSLMIGATLGVLSGFARGPLEAVLLRLTDTLLAFPSLVLALALAAYLGPGMFNVIIAVAVFNIPSNARLARAATMRVMAMGYITSTRLLGARPSYIIVRHVVPNIIGELLTYNAVRVGTAMTIEAALSYLGAGVRPPTPSWGSMISQGSQELSRYPYIALIPAIALFMAILFINLVGDALRERWEAR